MKVKIWDNRIKAFFETDGEPVALPGYEFLKCAITPCLTRERMVNITEVSTGCTIGSGGADLAEAVYQAYAFLRGKTRSEIQARIAETLAMQKESHESHSPEGTTP